MRRERGLVFWAVAGVFLALALQACTKPADETKGAHADMATMQLHHLHLLMDHGMGMYLQGSNMAMEARMKMAPGFDPVALEHGKTMMAKGRAVIERGLSGPEMEALHEQGEGMSELMAYTHGLGKDMLAVADILGRMGDEGIRMGDDMALHHLHIGLNHALEMATEGASLKMIGEMGMSGQPDAFAIEHGKNMIGDARMLYKEIMEGSAMQELHHKGVNTQDPRMEYTHELGDAVAKVIDTLEKMPQM